MHRQIALKESFLLTLTILSCMTTLASGKCTGYRSPVTFRSTEYTITSPKYPRSYSDHENCKFLLNAPFTHQDFMLVVNVTEYETSYLPHGETVRKCTGRLTFFKNEVDCRTLKPFCYVFYSTSYCAPVVQKTYPECTIQRRSTFNIAEVKFTSGSYYPTFTPQKGFKLKYKYLSCIPKTTTTTTTTTTTATTTTATPTTTTVTPSTTEATTTTEALTTTARTTTTPTSSIITTLVPTEATTQTENTTHLTELTTIPTEATMTATGATTTPTEATTTQTEAETIPTEAATISTEPTTTTLPTSTTTATPTIAATTLTTKETTDHYKASLSQFKTPQNTSNTTAIPSTTIILSKADLTRDTKSTTKESNKNLRGTIIENGNSEKQTEEGPPHWIYAPIAIGVLLVIAFIVIVIVRKRKKKAQDISWLVGFDNPEFREFSEKENKEIFIETGTSAPPNYYHTAPGTRL